MQHETRRGSRNSSAGSLARCRAADWLRARSADRIPTGTRAHSRVQAVSGLSADVVAMQDLTLLL